jgi:CHASE2 domain-containing sensor protein
MEKRISLEFYPVGRNGADGFQVSLEVWAGENSLGTSIGQLSFPTAVLSCYAEWQQSYRELGRFNHRGIKVKVVEIDGTLNQRQRRCQRLALDLQDALNQWLNEPSFLPLQMKWTTWINPNEQVRALICTDSTELWQLPWQQWKFLQSYSTVEIGFSRLAYESPPSAGAEARFPKIKILAILGNATGINVEQDREFLKQLPNADVTFLTEPQRQEVQHLLWQQQWNILFFAGHSHSEGNSKSRGRIYLHSGDSLTLAELRGTLTHAVKQGLQLAIFNSCDGLGLAHELEQLYIPALIVMREPVPDRVAQTFLKYFLTAFSESTSLYQAVKQARVQLEGLEDEFPCASWLPVICQNPAAPPFQWSTTPVADRSLQPWLRFKQAVIFSLMVAGIVTGIRWTGSLQAIELWALDRFMRWKPEEPIDTRLLVVEATEADIRQYGWPLSDAVLAKLLSKLQQAQPSVIGLDMLRDRPQEPGYAALMQQLQSDDRIVAICKHSELDDLGTPPPAMLPPERVGFSDVIPDPDDTVRRLLLSMEPANRSGCTAEFAFSVVLAQKYLAAEQIVSQPSLEGFLQMGNVVFRPLDLHMGGYHRADLAGHQVLMNYRRYRGSLVNIAQRVSLTDVLTDKLSHSAVLDRAVLIGITASSVKDEFKTPYPEKLRGLSLHAQIVSQLLDTVLEQRPVLRPLPWWGDLLWISGWSLTGGLLICFIHRRQQQIIVIGVSLLILPGLCFVFFLNGIWIALIPSGVAVLLSSVIASKLLTKYSCS